MPRYYIGASEWYPVYTLERVDDGDTTPGTVSVSDAIVEMYQEAEEKFAAAQHALGFLKKSSE